MSIKDIPASVWPTIIVSIIIPIIKFVATLLRSSVSPDFRIHTSWSKTNRDVLETIEKTPDNSFANKIALNSISQALIINSANAIFNASRPKRPFVDWLCVSVFGTLSAISIVSFPRPLNIFGAIIFLTLLAVCEISALLRSELNRHFKKFIRFCLVDSVNSKVLLENPEIAYQIFVREAQRSAYRTSPMITRNYSNWPQYWRIIKKFKVSLNKIFLFEVPENRYGIILKYIVARQKEIYKNF
ncbi:hypothetical protein [Rothia nasimurium]|uniref:hypothetical protein n=1 Tax=Rothia nasimurium TaxID=85336 RepID=UPI001F2D5127|nr:hypothetical protein [Rothia nasimurium]